MKTVISIALILVGIVGIYFVSRSSGPAAPVVEQVVIEREPEVREEKISVAVAKRDLDGKTVLTLDDFTTKVISVPEGSSEKAQFSIAGRGSLVNWALSAPVEEGSNIPVSLLIRPGTPDYIAMFLQPGNVIYPFTIPSSDYYIFDNLRVGEYVDIYLPYDRNPASGDVNSPGSRPSITNIRMKPLMVNKRVLAMSRSSAASKRNQTNPNNQNLIDGGDDRIIVELTDQEVKIIKALEGKAKFIIFPSVPAKVIAERINARKAQLEGNSDNALTNDELDSFPVSTEELFVGSSVVKRIQG